MKSNQQYLETFKKYLSKANLQQKEAIETIDGPVLVVAGPGTGKTQILALRIGNILNNTDTNANNILCLTYTEAGSVAMRKRLFSIIGPESLKVHIHTFHSFCNSVIQENRTYFGDNAGLKPISELEAIELYYEILSELPYGHILKRYTGDIHYEIKRLKSLFETMKKENLDSQYLLESATAYIENLPFNEDYIYKTNSKFGKKGEPKAKKIEEETKTIKVFMAAVELFDLYQAKMKKIERYDFNDMIHWVIVAFNTQETLLLKYQEQFQYFLVDEFQDTNGSQNTILNLLTNYWEDNPNIFAVGDDDQSVYSFQGAENKRISNYVSKYFNNLKAIVLAQNYRSTQSILDASKVTIENNLTRLILDDNLKAIFENKKTKLNKNLTSFSNSLEPSVHIRSYTNSYHEATDIAQYIENEHIKETNLSEIAIIYHNHFHVAHIIKAFEVKKIPYQINRKQNIFELPLIKNIITILTFISNENKEYDSGNFLLVKILHFNFYNIDLQDISVISLECDKNKQKWRKVISDKNLLFKLGITNISDITIIYESLLKSLKNLHNQTFQVFFENIIHDFGIMKYIMLSENKTEDLEVLTTFFNFLKEESVRNPSITLFDFLTIIEKMQKNNIELPIQQIVLQKNGVVFITAHASKGLEFETVYIINAEKKSWEEKKSSNNNFKFPPLDNNTTIKPEKNIEEERRLFYVAMTRAKKNLYISYPLMKVSDKSIELTSLECSRFITEITEKTDIKIEHIKLEDEAVNSFIETNFTLSLKPEIELVEHAYFEQKLSNYRLSVTHLNKFLKCPLTFYFENILLYPSARTPDAGFGIAIHYALENLFKNMLTNVNNEFPTKEQFLNYFKNGLTIYASHFTEEQYELKKEYAEQLLPEYYHYYIKNWKKNVITEYRFTNVVFEDVPLSGVIDKIEIEGENINVVDYKTGKSEKAKSKFKPPVEGNLDEDDFEKMYGGDYWRQIVFYKILMDNDLNRNWKMTSGEIDFLQKKSDNTFEKEKYYVTSEDELIVKNQIKTTYSRILKHDFKQGCGKPTCQWCNFVKENYVKKS